MLIYWPLLRFSFIILWKSFVYIIIYYTYVIDINRFNIYIFYMKLHSQVAKHSRPSNPNIFLLFILFFILHIYLYIFKELDEVWSHNAFCSEVILVEMLYYQKKKNIINKRNCTDYKIRLSYLSYEVYKLFGFEMVTNIGVTTIFVLGYLGPLSLLIVLFHVRLSKNWGIWTLKNF